MSAVETSWGSWDGDGWVDKPEAALGCGLVNPAPGAPRRGRGDGGAQGVCSTVWWWLSGYWCWMLGTGSPPSRWPFRAGHW